MADILFKEESYKIIGACFEVHKILGHGFSEAVYKDALELEFIKLEMPFVREKPFTITYKQQKLKHFFIADFVVYDTIYPGDKNWRIYWRPLYKTNTKLS